MQLLDVLGRRWVLRIFWELRGGPLTFRALQDACGGISPSVLNSRLAELREAMLVNADPDGYALSALGQELLERLLPVGKLADRWARAVSRSE